jgi:hypothetical protein
MKIDLDLYSDNLMLPEQELLQQRKLEPKVVKRILRLRDAYNYMLRNPLKKDREYVDYIISAAGLEGGKPLSRRSAYEDLEILHAIVGSLQQCAKEWHRWRFNNMIMEGYAIAVRHEDAVAIARLAQQYGKYNQLDKSDERDAGFSEIPRLRFVFDVSVLRFKPTPYAYKVMEQTIARYSGTPYADIIEDAEAVEVSEVPERTPQPETAEEEEEGGQDDEQ